MAMGAVSGVLGAAQLIGGISKTSAERKQVAANNEAQRRSLAAQREQILTQEQATFEQAALAQMDLEQNKTFAEYQTQMGQLQRQTANQQQVAAMQAQEKLENMQAQQAQFGIQADELTSLMETGQARAKNDAGLLSAGIQGNEAKLGVETDRYGQMIQGAQQMNQNEANRYGQLLQSSDAQVQAATLAGQANVQEQQTLGQIADAGKQVYHQLEADALATGKQLTAGEKRRASLQAMLAASGMGQGGQTDQAVQKSDKNEDIQGFIEQQLRANSVSDETAMQMVSEGRIAELGKMLGLKQADMVDRKALESAVMANLNANLTNDAINLQSQQVNRMADYKGHGIEFQMQAAIADAKMAANQITGQESLVNMNAQAQKEDILQTMMLNGMGRAAAMQAFDAAMAQDEHTDKINKIMAETGYQIQAGASASQAQAQLGSLAAQRGALQYVPQKAPSMLGGILSSAINAGSTVYGGIQQQQQANRAASLNNGVTNYGLTSLPMEVQQPSPSGLYGNWALNGNNKTVNSNVGLLSGYGR